MKRYIRSSTAESIYKIIDDVCYQQCRTYGLDVRYDTLVKYVINHLATKFGLDCGRDYTEEDVEKILDSYYYRMINGIS